MAGSRARATAVRQSLDKLAGGAGGPELAELARDIVAGRVDPRSLTTSNAYAQPLRQALSRFQDWYAKLGPAERARVVAEAHAQLVEPSD